MSVAEVREQVRETGLLAAGAPVVAMLSGGRDSVCLLDVAVALCGAERVTALHVNYGLRPEADEDERHCRETCDLLGAGIEVVRAHREPGATGNLHAWARELRYRAARELARRLDDWEGARLPAGGAGAPSTEHARAPIATGHTATDQLETILYRLAASPGRRALLGMACREGRLVRPLLRLTREQTASYCIERGLGWREDASNDSEEYARARVRHGLSKALESVHPAARSNVLRTSELLREETDVLEGLVEEALGGRPAIEIERFASLAPALRRLLLIRLAEDATGAFVPQAGDRAAELIELGRRGGRAQLHVGGLASAVVENGELRMVKIEPRAQRPRRGGQ
jgi:tRNA(Ile)-lysidine synthase